MGYSDNVDSPDINDPDVSSAKYDDKGSSGGGGGGGGGNDKNNDKNKNKDTDKKNKDNMKSGSKKLSKLVNKAESAMGMSDYAYPLANYNWDYKTYVDNNYEPSKLGVSDDISLSALKRDVQAGDKYLRALMTDSTPNENSIAGISDIDFTDPDFMSKIRANNQKPPYATFRTEYTEKDYPTSGKYSNSYFVRSGYCPVPNIRSKAECMSKDKAFEWKEGSVELPSAAKPSFSAKSQTPPPNGKCFKPRYSYVNHVSDTGLTDGFLPGLMNDMGSLNPSIMFSLIDKGIVEGDRQTSPPKFQLLPCFPKPIPALPKMEKFTQQYAPQNVNNDRINTKQLDLFVGITSMCIILFAFSIFIYMYR
jgi:hypothetical protein